MNEAQTYMDWIQPSWAPPAWLFGPVWSVLYLIIAISFGYVFLKVWRKQWPKAVALPFILNLIFNFLFTPIQFGIQSFWLSTVDIILVWVTIVWSIKVVWPYSRLVAYAQIPYLLWVSFATALQLTITYLNV